MLILSRVEANVRRYICGLTTLLLLFFWFSASAIDVGTEAQFNAAIINYNSNSQALTITLTSDIDLTAPLTPISNSSSARPRLTITTNTDGLREIDGQNQVQIMSIMASSNVRIEKIRFANGNDLASESRGGAIEMSASSIVTIANCEFVNNKALGGPNSQFASFGGAIHSEGNLAVFNSTFENNQATDNGGAIALSNPSSNLTVVASTFSNNSLTTGFFGGAINVCSVCTADISQSTFVGNKTNTNSANNDEGLSNDGGNLTISSNIFDDACDSSSSATVTDRGFNLYSSSNAGDHCGNPASAPNNMVGVDPLLGALTDNGGLTRTHALGINSPAINNGQVDFVNRADQRGVSRGTLPPDVGAFEFVFKDEFESPSRNNEIAQASDIGSGFFENLTIDNEGPNVDQDFYRVSLIGGQEFTVEINFKDAQADLDMVLLESSGTSIDGSFSTTDDELFSFTPLEDGEYILRIYPFLNDPGTLFYDLSLTGNRNLNEELCLPIKSTSGGFAVVCL